VGNGQEGEVCGRWRSFLVVVSGGEAVATGGLFEKLLERKKGVYFRVFERNLD